MKKFNKEDYKICIVGLGYVGLPLAARFSLKGFDVTGFDIKEERINQLVNKIDINNDISTTTGPINPTSQMHPILQITDLIGRL